MRVPYTKRPLTFDQQVAQLESRGMLIPDREEAKRWLARISYYRLSAYWYPLRDANDGFLPGASFTDATTRYEFDRRLRLVVMAGLERVEVLTRTAVTYALAMKHGAFAHTVSSSFEPTFRHAEWCGRLEEEIERAEEAFLDHYRNKYVGFPVIPIWMATEVMSFGSLSTLVKRGLRRSEQDEVAKRLHVHPSLLSSWLHTLSVVRNVCAHHGRLWNRHLGVSPSVPKYDPKWSGVHAHRVFSVFLILRQIIAQTDAGHWWADASALLAETDGKPEVQTAMSVPTNWRLRN
jgi:abortive infection bacteriophage resistance protein